MLPVPWKGLVGAQKSSCGDAESFDLSEVDEMAELQAAVAAAKVRDRICVF